MTASEKLRALDGTMDEKPWYAVANDLIGGYLIANRDAPASELGRSDKQYADFLTEDQARAIAALRNSLPLIADVIEAAEGHERLWRGWNYPDTDPRKKLPAALTALRDALEGGDE